MAAGVPAACSDIPPLREVAGSTVHFFDPFSDEALAGALERLCAETIETGEAQKRAEQFTWERNARATLDYLKRSSS
jgi:glycosyltransferase involved in cell wall biosynthesis